MSPNSVNGISFFNSAALEPLVTLGTNVPVRCLLKFSGTNPFFGIVQTVANEVY